MTLNTLCEENMKPNPRRSDGAPGAQLFWKITLTVVCAIAGGILLLYVFKVL
jgi:hypothetical protein